MLACSGNAALASHREMPTTVICSNCDYLRDLLNISLERNGVLAQQLRAAHAALAAVRELHPSQHVVPRDEQSTSHDRAVSPAPVMSVAAASADAVDGCRRPVSKSALRPAHDSNSSVDPGIVKPPKATTGRRTSQQRSQHRKRDRES